jgi:hypothetical protein
VVKDLQRPESKEEDRQEDVYSRDAAGGLKTDRTFYCPSGSFLVSVMGSQRWRQKPGAYWHISVKDRRVEGRVGNHLDYLESLGINRGREGRGKAQALQM